MTKAELFHRVEMKTGKPKEEVKEIAEALFDELKASMIEGHDVYVRGFGSFVLKTRKAKTARNIGKGEPMSIPEHRIAAFRPAIEFKEKVRGGKI